MSKRRGCRYCGRQNCALFGGYCTQFCKEAHQPPRKIEQSRLVPALQAVAERADVYWNLLCALSPYARHRDNCNASEDYDDEERCTCGYDDMVAKVSEQLLARDRRLPEKAV